jgi:DNA polymerase (family 10)
MSNKEIAKIFQRLGDIMELHGENPFKIRSYHNAYISLRNLETPLAEMSRENVDSIKGIGKAIGDKIEELLRTGKLQTLDKYRAITPPGVEEMLDISGLGPKKAAQIWKELGIESVGELQYAVNENRLLALKGFGAKTQEELNKKLEFYQVSKGKRIFASVETEALALCKTMERIFSDKKVALVGDLARFCPTIESIAFLVGQEDINDALLKVKGLDIEQADGNPIEGRTASGLLVRIFTCNPNEFGSRQFQLTASPEFLHAFTDAFPGKDFNNLPDEAALFRRAGINFISPELRDLPEFVQRIKSGKASELIKASDIAGIIHTHTTYSDGLNTLREMSFVAQAMGYSYIGITDHSKAAFYAQGLEPERVEKQWQEIDALNLELSQTGQAFRILKGIESDILFDGHLDYDDAMLAGFDFVIASIHSNLSMDEDKATRRLIAAIENPYTTILGHPTGRLLLSRAGYPIDHRKVIEACAANKVAIELNANPHRLDLNYTWIPYAVDKGVLISINPDAHSCEGMLDLRHGIFAARKGGLRKEDCLNARSVDEFLAFAAQKR